MRIDPIENRDAFIRLIDSYLSQVPKVPVTLAMNEDIVALMQYCGALRELLETLVEHIELDKIELTASPKKVSEYVKVEKPVVKPVPVREPAPEPEPESLPSAEKPEEKRPHPKLGREEQQRADTLAALEETKWNRSAAAEKLGLRPATLSARIKRWWPDRVRKPLEITPGELLAALGQYEWNRALTGRKLGISVTTVQNMIKANWPHKVEHDEERLARLAERPEYVKEVLEKYGWNPKTARRTLRVSYEWLDQFIENHWPERSRTNVVPLLPSPISLPGQEA
jgi:lambda repressor-like predicted transcriptional regulator